MATEEASEYHSNNLNVIWILLFISWLIYIESNIVYFHMP